MGSNYSQIGNEWYIAIQHVYANKVFLMKYVKQLHKKSLICANMRKCNHMSQRELADRSGVKQQMIARFESGINTPNMSTVLKLLAAFGKTLYIGDLKNVELEDGAEPAAEVAAVIETPTGASIGNESLQKSDITE